MEPCTWYNETHSTERGNVWSSGHPVKSVHTKVQETRGANEVKSAFARQLHPKFLWACIHSREENAMVTPVTVQVSLLFHFFSYFCNTCSVFIWFSSALVHSGILWLIKISSFQRSLTVVTVLTQGVWLLIHTIDQALLTELQTVSWPQRRVGVKSIAHMCTT